MSQALGVWLRLRMAGVLPVLLLSQQITRCDGLASEAVRGVIGSRDMRATEPEQSKPSLQTEHKPKRKVTEADAIPMMQIAGPGAIRSYAGTLTRDFASFSPRRDKFVVILKRGNLATNTNDYWMALYKTDDLFQSPQPRTLVLMSSSSNREAIKDIRWLADDETILFLGERPGETTQLYSVRCDSGELQKLTNHPTNLIAYSADATGDTIVYASEKAPKSVVSPEFLRNGLVVSNESMTDLISGQIHDDERQLFVRQKGGIERPLHVPDELSGKVWGDIVEMYLSPNGQYLALKTNLTEIPTAWRQYAEPLLKRIITRDLPKGVPSWVFRYGIIDTRSGAGHVLLNSPVSYYGSEVAWSEDSRSVIVTGAFLPLTGGDFLDEKKSTHRPYALELDALTRSYSTLGDGDFQLLDWDQRRGVVKGLPRRRDSAAGDAQPEYYEKRGHHWERVNVSPQMDSGPGIEVTSEQDLNTPPKLVVTGSKAAQKAVLLELNPEFKNLEFGLVEEVEFAGAGDRAVHAGLYLPPGHVPNVRYPLVIQTHGFDPKGFWMDGSFTTAFAAQALAARGIAVLQIPDSHEWDETPDEAPKMAETFERAIRYLDQRGIVDIKRVGIIGFSRTGLYVHYMLTHSEVHFAAAIVADGSDGGYSQYIQFLSASPYAASDSEAINGGTPFGEGISSWLKRSPEFLLTKVETPLLIQVASLRTLSSQWGIFSGLRRLGKPVELVFLPTGTHILQKPWDRLVSQQGSVDWLAFWLMGEEDSDPSKAGQYNRWRSLRRLADGSPRRTSSSP